MEPKTSGKKNYSETKNQKRDFKSFVKGGRPQISDVLLKKIRKEADGVKVNELSIFESIKEGVGSKKYEISSNGKMKVSDYAERIIKYLQEGDEYKAYLHAKNKAIGKCISVAEVIKRELTSVKQENQIFSSSEESKEGHEEIEHAHIVITLTKEKVPIQELSNV